MLSDVYPTLIGGQEREVQLLSEGLSRKGHDVCVCTLLHYPAPPLVQENGVKVYRLTGTYQSIPFLYGNKRKIRYHPPIADANLAQQIRAVIEKNKPDIVHAHGWMLYSLLSARLKSRIRLVVTFHDYGFVCPARWSPLYPGGICDNPLQLSRCIDCGMHTYGKGIRGFGKTLMTYKGVKSHRAFACDALIYTNPNICEKMDYLKMDKYYLEHPVDTDEYRPMAISQYMDRVLCWAKLDRIKGIDMVFDAARKVPEYEFDIIYVGDDREYYRARKPRNVNLLPQLERNAIAPFLNKYPLVIGQLALGVFGLAELEAMSCRKPVISNWDRKYDVYYKSACPIISSSDSAEIASLVRSNIGNGSLGAAGRRWMLENHSVMKVVDKLLKIYGATLER